MNNFPQDEWNTPNFMKILQNRCPGNYTIEDDPVLKYCFLLKFNCDTDKAWFYLRYMGK
jgi:hypothetical protein